MDVYFTKKEKIVLIILVILLLLSSSLTYLYISAKNEIEKLTTDLESERENFRVLHTRYDEVYQDLQIANKTIEDYKIKINFLTQKQYQDSLKIDSLEKSLLIANKKIDKLTNYINYLTDIIKRDQIELEEARNGNRDDVEKLEERLRETEEELNTAQNELARLQSDISSNNEEISLLDKEQVRVSNTINQVVQLANIDFGLAIKTKRKTRKQKLRDVTGYIFNISPYSGVTQNGFADFYFAVYKAYGPTSEFVIQTHNQITSPPVFKDAIKGDVPYTAKYENAPVQRTNAPGLPTSSEEFVIILPESQRVFVEGHVCKLVIWQKIVNQDTGEFFLAEVGNSVFTVKK